MQERVLVGISHAVACLIYHVLSYQEECSGGRMCMCGVCVCVEEGYHMTAYIPCVWMYEMGERN